MADARKKPDYGIDPRSFVQAWEESGSVDEVYRRLAEVSRAKGLLVMPVPVIVARASGYRSAGVDLKRMPRPGRALDVAGLNQLVADIQKRRGEVPASPPDAGSGSKPAKRKPPG